MISFMISFILGLKFYDIFGWIYELVVRKDYCWYLFILKLLIDFKIFLLSMDMRVLFSLFVFNWLILGVLEDFVGDFFLYIFFMGWVVV